MKVTPLDLRQQTFRTALRGFDRNEVLSFLKEVADDYELALRENARWQQDLAHMQTALNEHREHEKNLRNTLLTAQRLADEIRENAQQEARMILREAEGRSELLIRKSQLRVEEIERGIQELKLKRRDVEHSLESSVAAVKHALDFVRQQDARELEERVRLEEALEAVQTQSEAPSPAPRTEIFVGARLPETVAPATANSIEEGLEAVQRFIDATRVADRAPQGQ